MASPVTRQPLERAGASHPQLDGAQPSVAATEPASPSPRRARRRLVMASVLLLLVALAVFTIWRLFFAAPSLPPGVIGGSGRIEGDDSAVSPKTSGRVQEITVREGDRVAAGDLIAVLDDAQVRAREDQAEAMVREADARLATAEAQQAQA